MAITTLSILLIAPLLLALLPALAGLAGGGLSYLGARRQDKINQRNQENQNISDRMYSNDMYSWQRRDALADWNMNNQYNHPAQQMQRLREAGLNPHLVYGGGAQTTATMVRSVNQSLNSQPAPKGNVDILPQAVESMFSNMNSVWQGKQMQAQTDNLKEQQKVLQQETLLKAAQTYETLKKGEGTEFDNYMKRQLEDSIMKGSILNLDKTQAEIDNLKATTKSTLTTEEINRLKSSQDRVKTAWEITLLKQKQKLDQQQLDNLQQEFKLKVNENALKEIELKLRQMGLNPNDPTYWKIYYQMILNLLGSSNGSVLGN